MSSRQVADGYRQRLRFQFRTLLSTPLRDCSLRYNTSVRNALSTWAAPGKRYFAASPLADYSPGGASLDGGTGTGGTGGTGGMGGPGGAGITAGAPGGAGTNAVRGGVTHVMTATPVTAPAMKAMTKRGAPARRHAVHASPIPHAIQPVHRRCRAIRTARRSVRRQEVPVPSLVGSMDACSGGD